MIFGDLFGRLNRLQATLPFKIAASAVLTVVVITVAASYAISVRRAAEASSPAAAAVTAEPASPSSSPAQGRPRNEAQRNIGDAAEVDPELARLLSAEELTAKAIDQILARQVDPTAVAVGCAIAWAIGLLVIWLDLGLTYLALLLVTVLVVAPMIAAGRYAPPLSGIAPLAQKLATVGKFLAAVVALTASFTALMRGLHLALGTKGPITAIARNVVLEAVRMKVSLVFIVMLVFVLAALPGLLHESTPLRYRVQSFLQYGTGGAFWIIAILVLFLSVGTVAFEQRDRVIWQTMTKPVAAWQYLLGKWLGVVGVAAVLLAVATSGVFLFTEYLRNQPALDEIRPYVARDAELGGARLSEDRFVLETQVLAAREIVRPTLPELPPAEKEAEYRRRLEAEMRDDPGVRDDSYNRQRIMDQIDTEFLGSLLTIGPGRVQRYLFEGLHEARKSGRLLSLRYRIRAGGDDPRDFYRLTFVLQGGEHIVREAPLDHTLTLDLSPAAISSDGTLEIFIVNGDVERNTSNPKTITFPPDGIELYYAAGSYRLNFLRVVLLLWLKLAFLAMVGVVAATFLSFPVASLVAFGVFLMAESSAFLAGSLDYFGGEWGERDFELWRFIVRSIAEPVIWIFRFYSRLRPTEYLVDGILLHWSSAARSVLLIALLVAALYAVGVVVFRRRELAIYSGQ